MADAVKIPRRRESSETLVTKEEEDDYLKKGNTETLMKIIGLELSQHTITKGSDNTPNR